MITEVGHFHKLPFWLGMMCGVCEMYVGSVPRFQLLWERRHCVYGETQHTHTGSVSRLRFCVTVPHIKKMGQTLWPLRCIEASLGSGAQKTVWLHFSRVWGCAVSHAQPLEGIPIHCSEPRVTVAPSHSLYQDLNGASHWILCQPDQASKTEPIWSGWCKITALCH